MTPQVLLLLSLVSAEPARSVDFDSEIVPILTKAGCNAGACHGAAAGRGGFYLSLFGSDPAADHDAIVHELEGRRVNLANPELSLVVNKPTGSMRHGGGTRLDPDGPGARRLAQWIKAGAPRAKTPRKLTAFELQPTSQIVEREGAPIKLRALARFDDGPALDVTPWTVFTSSDPSAVEIVKETATVRRRGQHIIIARFLDRVVPLRLTLPFSDAPIDLSREPRANFIDDEILKSLAVLRIPPSPRTGDAAFLRRLRLDLTGRLPTPDEVSSFVADRSADKRHKLIDSLLASDDFVEYWTHKLASLYRVRPQPAETAGMRAFHAWIKDSLRKRTPFDGSAREAITAVGDSHKYGPAYFHRLTNDARGEAELVGQVFLGVRLQCANCHNHPLDRWTQDDYHGLAAIFARLERGREVRVGNRGAVTNPRTSEPAIPRIPGERYLDADKDSREAFAKWLTAADNPYFARATVNRLWRSMFGRGLVEPADDLRDTNPATHPELLDMLAADFIKHGHDIRHTLRLIARSEAYARGSETQAANKADDRFYSQALRRPLSPEVLADAISDVTGVPEQYGEEPPGTRAISLIDPGTPSRALDVLGRCSRRDSCESDTAPGGLPAMLHRLNGELMNRKIASKDGRLHRLIAAGKSNEVIIGELYLLAFGRSPTKEEQRFWKGQTETASKTDRTEFLEDLLWSLLNSREFTTNR
jgi:hypothetical protein